MSGDEGDATSRLLLLVVAMRQALLERAPPGETASLALQAGGRTICTFEAEPFLVDLGQVVRERVEAEEGRGPDGGDS